MPPYKKQSIGNRLTYALESVIRGCKRPGKFESPAKIKLSASTHLLLKCFWLGRIVIYRAAREEHHTMPRYNL